VLCLYIRISVYTYVCIGVGVVRLDEYNTLRCGRLTSLYIFHTHNPNRSLPQIAAFDVGSGDDEEGKGSCEAVYPHKVRAWGGWVIGVVCTGGGWVE
jgi:hypothetical protein